MARGGARTSIGTNLANRAIRQAPAARETKSRALRFATALRDVDAALSLDAHRHAHRSARCLLSSWPIDSAARDQLARRADRAAAEVNARFATRWRTSTRPRARGFDHSLSRALRFHARRSRARLPCGPGPRRATVSDGSAAAEAPAAARISRRNDLQERRADRLLRRPVAVRANGERVQSVL